MHRSLALLAAVASAALIVSFAILRNGWASTDDAPSLPRADTEVTIWSRTASAPISPGFVGVSVEYPALTAYAGSDSRRLDPAFEQLLRNLAPGQSPVLRIGGDSSDTTWWPVAGVHRPAGVTYSLSPRWLAVVRRLATDTGARLILGIDLEAGQPGLARAEGRALLRGLGGRVLRALEIGNEPTRYVLFPWYHTRSGHAVFARRRGYGFGSFATEFTHVASLLPASVPLAGPTLTGFGWMRNLGAFLGAQRHIGVVTFHRYPLNRCFTTVRSPQYPTVANLLDARSSRGLGQSLAAYVSIAHRHGLPFRLDEINSVACGGKAGVSNTLASSLWALDTLFATARAGVSGVNVHTFPGAAYALFSFRRAGGRWLTSVRPEYYGLLMFAWAAPPGSRIVAVRQRGGSAVRSWGTRGADGTIRVTLINDDPARPHVVLVRLPSGARRPATLIRLRGPGLDATAGVTLGGRSFAPTSGGRLGQVRSSAVASPAPGEYLVSVPAASAALLRIPQG